MAEVGNKRFAESAVRQLWGGSEVLVLESNQNHASAEETEISPTLPAAMGCGGYVPMIVDTLVFDESQITCPTNGLNPKWGGLCHSLTREAGRTVVIIKQGEPIVFRDDITIKFDGGGVAFTLGARDFKGVQCVSYQNITGTLNQGAHPGSYNGQDAYNDMLVTDNGIFNSEDRDLQAVRAEPHVEREGLQGRDRPDTRGG